MSARSHRQRCLTTSPLNSLPPSLRKTRGMSKVKHNWSKCCATLFALLVGVGKAKGNLDALSTASKMYSSPAKDVVPIRSRSTSNTSHGSTARAGRRASCWLLLRFRRLQPHDRTYSRTSRTIVGQKTVLVLGRGWMLPQSARVGDG